MRNASALSRTMFALGFLGAYSIAALLLLLTLKEVAADRYSGSGITYRNRDTLESDFDIVADTSSEIEKYLNRIKPEIGNPVGQSANTSEDGSGPGQLASSNFPNNSSTPRTNLIPTS